MAQVQLVQDFKLIREQVNNTRHQRAPVSGGNFEQRFSKDLPTFGIIIAAGKALRLGNVYVSLSVLRRHISSKLPVEIWHVGSDELDAASRAYFEAQFAPLRCIDAETVPQPAHHRPPASLNGYALKIFALYATTLDRVLGLDSDCMITINPLNLFTSPPFREHGNLFWPDLFRKGLEMVSGVSPKLYGLFGLRLPWEGQEQAFMWAESGQFLIDRSRHWDVIEYLWLLNTHADPTHKLAYGDKDTFLLAFLLAGKGESYYQVGEWARLCVHQLPQRPGAKLEHVGLLHHAPDATIAFLHRTAGGKLDPLVDTVKTVDFVTPPLHPLWLSHPARRQAFSCA
ncbi:hypothetical protein WJX73_006806 [Symbiochloris irregularis]|uniref:Uncharacterized protein n=1 Tax=Symbiochloris irregularis TaxID=706552 RepID=A0AAW1PYT7_9CHLO